MLNPSYLDSSVIFIVLSRGDGLSRYIPDIGIKKVIIARIIPKTLIEDSFILKGSSSSLSRLTVLAAIEDSFLEFVFNEFSGFLSIKVVFIKINFQPDLLTLQSRGK
tara:strand:+ start:845 stop:1165 length:321 start_codon:yes stop_codon:yes gene_type:complete